MKKSYISPETIVIELDAEALCQATVITASPTMNNTTPEDEPENSKDNQFSASYRSNLWEL